MDVWKRKRLEARGWKVGSAKEVLRLSDEEEAYIELRLKLAEGLKARRVDKGLTQIQLARAVQSSQSRVAKMEAGDRTVSLDLRVRSLLALGASNVELAKIIARHNAIEATLARAEEYGAAARSALAIFPASPYRRALEGLVDFCIERAY